MLSKGKGKGSGGIEGIENLPFSEESRLEGDGALNLPKKKTALKA